MATVITVDGLRKTYGARTAIEDVSFEVEAGEIFGILGPNGAGKTTTVECIQGLRRPDKGAIRVLGLDPATGAAQVVICWLPLVQRWLHRRCRRCFGTGRRGSRHRRRACVRTCGASCLRRHR